MGGQASPESVQAQLGSWAQAFGPAIGQTGAATQERVAASQTNNPYYSKTGFVSNYTPRPQQQRPTSNPWAGYGAASQQARQAAWSAPGPYAGKSTPNPAADALRRYQGIGSQMPSQAPAQYPGQVPPGGVTAVNKQQPVIGSTPGVMPPMDGGTQGGGGVVPPTRLPGQAGFTPEGGYTMPGISKPFEQPAPPPSPTQADDYFKGGPLAPRPTLGEPTPAPMDFPAPVAPAPAAVASPTVAALRAPSVPGTIGGVAPKKNTPRPSLYEEV